MRRYLLVVIFFTLGFVLVGCGGHRVGTSGPQFADNMITLADFADLHFNAKEYIHDMTEVVPGKIWLHQVQGARLSRYRSFAVLALPSRFVSQQKNVPIALLEGELQASLQQQLRELSLGHGENGGKVLTVKAMVVEAKPGSRIARYLIGIMGAGKASVAVAVEVFEPGQSQPSLLLYGKGILASGEYGGNSAGLLTKVISSLSQQLAAQIIAARRS